MAIYDIIYTESDYFIMEITGVTGFSGFAVLFVFGMLANADPETGFFRFCVARPVGKESLYIKKSKSNIITRNKQDKKKERF